MDPGRRRIAIAFAAVLVIGASVGMFFVFRSSPEGGSVPGVGKVAHDFAAKTITGGHVDLATYHGKPVVVAFGASWCHPCTLEYPLLVRSLAEHHDGFSIVGVSYQDSPSLMHELMRRVGASWPVADDSDGTIASQWGVHNIPATFFISRAGVVVSIGYGLTTAGAVESHVRQLLAS
jgi:peroxiredoxin